jgi:hypothetical protein
MEGAVEQLILGAHTSRIEQTFEYARPEIRVST